MRMAWEQCCAALMGCLERLDLQSENLDKIHCAIRECLAPLARELHVARSESSFRIQPSAFAPDGGMRKFCMAFAGGATGEDGTLCIPYDALATERGSVVLWPTAGHVWDEEERQQLRAVSQFIFLVMSRAAFLGRLNRMPFLDVMTGLANTPGMNRFLAGLCEAGRLADYAGCFINIKNMKALNQRFGMRSIDAMLRQYALNLYHFTNPSEELAARLGGDNFLLCVRKERIEELLAQVERMVLPIDSKGKTFPVRVESRCGVYLAREGDTDDAFMQSVSLAATLAREKQQGIMRFTQDIRERVVEGQRMVLAMPRAMRDGEIVPFYQPKVAMGDKRLCGAEALVRWLKDGKPVSPGVFLPAIERNGQLHELDIFIFETVCRHIRRWLDEGLEPVRLSVNFGREDLLIPTIVQDILDILERYRLDGKYVEIELTETSAYGNVDELNRFIGQMQQHGIRIAMDDFGTGYSSLNFLKKADFNVVKLDKSFVDNIEKNVKKDEIMLRSMVRMLRDMDVEVVAEGVETEQQAAFMQGIECNIIQGYYFDRPLPVAEFEQRLRQRDYV